MMSNQLSTNLAEVGTDCISRQDALEAFGLSEKTRKYGGDHSGYDTMMMYEIQDTIENLPPIQPKRGRWTRTGSGSLYDHYECSECGKAPKWECMGDNRWKIAFTGFCPNCGADMREVNNESN